MASENKTSNLQLNQWNGNEYPKRTDFNEDNKKIDEAYASLESQMADITKQVESIEVTAEKTTLNSSKFVSKNVKAGMEELFTFADNGKKNIATVIGSPLSNTDSFDSMKSKIQTMKNTFASNLTVKEQSSSGSESLESLINKVKNINPQKKWAEGNHRQTVESDAESTRNVNFNVSLSWKPSCIAVFKKESYYNYEVTIAMFVTDSTLKNALTTNIYSSRLDKFNFIHSDRSKISILSDTSFKVSDYTQSSATYYWLAIEL